MDEINEANKTLNSLIHEENEKPISESAAILGIQLNITESQYLHFTEQLGKEEKLTISDDGDRVYIFKLTGLGINAPGKLKPLFYRGNLYKLQVYVTSPHLNDPSFEETTTSIIGSEVRSLYMSKYGGGGSSNFVVMPDIIDDKNDALIWVFGKMMIKVERDVTGAIISYVYLPTQNAIDTEKTSADSLNEIKLKKEI